MTRHAAREQAVDWFVRRDARPRDSAGEAAFAAWIAADPAHRAAYLEIERLWAELDEAPATASATAATRHRVARPTAIWAAVAALAAALVLLVGLGTDPFVRLQADALTGVGEVETVSLPDGSAVVLNTDSAVAVDYGPDVRRVRLLQGEAEFQVAKDPDRPFRVEAAGGSSTALGTVFLVDRHVGEVTVSVLEGRVAVARDGAPPPSVLGAHQRVSYTRHRAPGAPTGFDPHTLTAWQRGKLVFEDRPLSEVVAELDRYHRGTIRVLDETLGRRAVNGVFDIDDPVAAVDALERSLGLRSTRLTDLLILLHP